MEYITHRNQRIPLLGLGSWMLGTDKAKMSAEASLTRDFILHHEMTLLDTAEMYADGEAEKVIGNAILGLDRSSLFIVGKILPENAEKGNYEESCRRSLSHLGISCFDLYLLHWKADVNLQDMVDHMEMLVRKGLIRNWGVSNFDTEEMEELFRCENGSHCFCNQCLYNLKARGVEYDLIPWCNQHDVLFMAYSPMCDFREDRERITSDTAIITIAKEENKTPESLMLSFVIRNKDVITVFKTSNPDHLIADLENVFDPISEEHMYAINRIYPKPEHKVPLEKI